MCVLGGGRGGSTVTVTVIVWWCTENVQVFDVLKCFFVYRSLEFMWHTSIETKRTQEVYLAHFFEKKVGKKTKLGSTVVCSLPVALNCSSLSTYTVDKTRW